MSSHHLSHHPCSPAHPPSTAEGLSLSLIKSECGDLQDMSEISPYSGSAISFHLHPTPTPPQGENKPKPTSLPPRSGLPKVLESCRFLSSPVCPLIRSHSLFSTRAWRFWLHKSFTGNQHPCNFDKLLIAPKPSCFICAFAAVFFSAVSSYSFSPPRVFLEDRRGGNLSVILHSSDFNIVS